MVFTDANRDGYGFTVHRLQKLICNGKFTFHDKQQSSTFRGLLAVKLVLQSYAKNLSNQARQINMDNFSATRILEIGSSKEHLQKLARDIFPHSEITSKLHLFNLFIIFIYRSSKKNSRTLKRIAN